MGVKTKYKLEDFDGKLAGINARQARSLAEIETARLNGKEPPAAAVEQLTKLSAQAEEIRKRMNKG